MKKRRLSLDKELVTGAGLNDGGRGITIILWSIIQSVSLVEPPLCDCVDTDSCGTDGCSDANCYSTNCPTATCEIC